MCVQKREHVDGWRDEQICSLKLLRTSSPVYIVRRGGCRSNIVSYKLYIRQYFQATKDCLTREYSFEEGNGATRDQYLADNNINTFIITGFTDQETENNNQQEKTPELEADVKTDSPVLTVENLPKVGNTNII